MYIWSVFDEGINLPTEIDINELKSMNSMNHVFVRVLKGGDVAEEPYLSVKIRAQSFNCVYATSQ